MTSKEDFRDELIEKLGDIEVAIGNVELSAPNNDDIVRALADISENTDITVLPKYLKRDFERVEEAIAQHTKHEDKMARILRQLRDEGTADISDIDTRLGDCLANKHAVCMYPRTECHFKCGKRIFATFELLQQHLARGREAEAHANPQQRSYMVDDISSVDGRIAKRAKHSDGVEKPAQRTVK